MIVVCIMLETAPLVRADDQADLKAVIDKAVKAMGGQEKLAKHQGVTIKSKGKVSINGMEFEFTAESHVQPPTKNRVQIDGDFNGMKFTQIRISNGDKGWVSAMGMVTEMGEDELANAKDDLYAGWVASLVPLNDPTFKLAPLGESKVSDRPVLGVKVSHKDQKDVNLYFDKENGLLVKAARRAKDMMGAEVDQETFFSEYKDVDGVKRWKKLTIKRDGNTFLEMEATDIKAVEKLDDNLFGKPGQ
jgi:hypothetical protein